MKSKIQKSFPNKNLSMTLWCGDAKNKSV